MMSLHIASDALLKGCSERFKINPDKEKMIRYFVLALKNTMDYSTDYIQNNTNEVINHFVFSCPCCRLDHVKPIITFMKQFEKSLQTITTMERSPFPTNCWLLKTFDKYSYIHYHVKNM